MKLLAVYESWLEKSALISGGYFYQGKRVYGIKPVSYRFMDVILAGCDEPLLLHINTEIQSGKGVQDHASDDI